MLASESWRERGALRGSRAIGISARVEHLFIVIFSFFVGILIFVFAFFVGKLVLDSECVGSLVTETRDFG